MTPEDLTWTSDDELYALEQQRSLDPHELARIEAELQRRRTSRRAALADVAMPAAEAPTLGDLERVTRGLEANLDVRLAALDSRLRRLKWWVFAIPLVWAVIGAATWLALSEWAPQTLRGVGLP